MRRKVLIAEPDAPARESLSAALGGAGFEVVAVSSGTEALRRVRLEVFSLLVLEVELPEADGFEVCCELKRDIRTSQIPVLFATARGADIDRIIGLEIGGDDYVVKPFNVRELILRMKRTLGRTQGVAAGPSRLAVGELALDRTKAKVWVQGEEVRLTAQEFKLLSLLMERKGAIQTHHQLLRDAWQYDVFSNTRTLHTHIRRLRIKLGGLRHYIENVRDMGYRIRDVEFEDGEPLRAAA